MTRWFNKCSILTICLLCLYKMLSNKMHITEPTRITKMSSSILDQFITNIPGFIQGTNVDPPLLTNHLTISISLKFKVSKGPVIVSRFVHVVVPRFKYPRSMLRSGGEMSSLQPFDTLCYVVLRCTTLCHVVPRCATQCVMLCHVVPRCTTSKFTLVLHFRPNFPRYVWLDENVSQSEACVNVTGHCTNATELT